MEQGIQWKSSERKFQNTARQQSWRVMPPNSSFPPGFPQLSRLPLKKPFKIGREPPEGLRGAVLGAASTAAAGLGMEPAPRSQSGKPRCESWHQYGENLSLVVTQSRITRDAEKQGNMTPISRNMY